MKLKLLKISILVCMVSLSLGVLAVKAEEGSTSTKPPIGQLKANIENRLEKNREVRNTRLEDKKNLQASTSMIRKEAREDIRDIRASSTMMFKVRKDEKREIKKEMKVDVFAIRKDALIKELTMTLNNLFRIRNKTVDLITRAESKGRDMTKARAQLVIADEKLAKARIAVDVLKALSAPVTSTASTTVSVNLDKPRKVGDDAIKAVKDARDALKKVVEFVAQSMGKGDEKRSATSTPPASATTTPSIN